MKFIAQESFAVVGDDEVGGVAEYHELVEESDGVGGS